MTTQRISDIHTDYMLDVEVLQAKLDRALEELDIARTREFNTQQACARWKQELEKAKAEIARLSALVGARQ